MNQKELTTRFGVDGRIRFDSGNGGLTRLLVNTDAASAEIYLHGAHITSYNQKNQRPLIWMSEESRFADGLPIRGGVPVCFPWFGAHPENDDMPIHGFARLMEWDVADIKELSENSIEARFSLSSTPWMSRKWPGEFSAEYTVSVGPSLDIQLSVTNTGRDEFVYTCALHSYFAVSDIRNVRVTGLEGIGYLDKVTGDPQKIVEDEPITFTEETDRTYLDAETTCEIIDPGANRTIRIEKTGSKSTVVWNPWSGKAGRMEDFGDEEWKEMLCVETANARGNEMRLQPDARHTTRAVLSYSSLIEGNS